MYIFNGMVYTSRKAAEEAKKDFLDLKGGNDQKYTMSKSLNDIKLIKREGQARRSPAQSMFS